MRFITLIPVIFLSSNLYAQERLAISLAGEKIEDFTNREFYIEEVVDATGQEVIGISKLGGSSALDDIVLSEGIATELRELLKKSMPLNHDQVGLTLVVKKLNSFEHIMQTSETIGVSLDAQIFLGDTLLYSNSLRKSFSGKFKYQQYSTFISRTVQQFIYDFAVVPPPKETSVEEVKEDDQKVELNQSRNVVAIGYQIGDLLLLD